MISQNSKLKAALLQRDDNTPTVGLRDLQRYYALLNYYFLADIVGTAISPSWDAVAKLAAITGIRTFLNFFLQQEVRKLRETALSPLATKPAKD